MSFIPRPYQEEDLGGIWRFRGRCLLAWEQGLGKTAESLWWISKIRLRRPAVILTPCSVKYSWQHEAQTLFGLRTRVLSGQGPREKNLVLRDDILIINYDILHFWVKILMRRPPRIVIMDECQYVSNPRARRTKAAKSICAEAQSVLGLSGTPMTTKPVQLWSVLNMIRPDLFPDFSDYAWRYCEPRHTRWGWKFDGAVRKKELWNILTKEVMIRRLKKDVAPELPDKIYKTIPMMMSAKQREEYNRATDKFITWLKEKSPARAHRARKAQAMVKVGYLLRLCAWLKLPQVVKFIEEFHETHPGVKVVGMTGNTFVIDRLAKEFPLSVTIDGRHTGDRHATGRKFCESKQINDLWGNWVAAGTGLNLQKSHSFLALDPPKSPGVFMQGQDRVHRIGQLKQVIIYTPILIGTVEEKRWKILHKRSGILREIIDGESEDQTEESQFDELLNQIKKEYNV